MSNEIKQPGYSYRGFVTSKWYGILKEEKNVTSEWCVAIAGDAIHIWLTEPFQRLCYTLKNLCDKVTAVSQTQVSSRTLCTVADRFEKLMKDEMLPLHLKLLEEFESDDILTKGEQVLTLFQIWIEEIGDLIEIFQTLKSLPMQEQIMADIILEHELKVLYEDMTEVFSLMKRVDQRAS